MKKLLLLAIPIMMVGCMKERKYVVVHHKNMHDTVTTNSFTHYVDRRTVDMHEGGSFTEVEYIKCIE